ncbi:hypothetical protein [Streptomyces sp. SAJ15]|uniref:hypothetical protein n=1 Tax=Streptomyces sp. SAJ15 TaxID=2011095 RepID=UPI0011850DEC|nr:hypothetical protein [Streptomyces sp. SAJ15]TVL93682.1 hypothetical protein CD790_01055 [Streptomyces sp. SAJ15]
MSLMSWRSRRTRGRGPGDRGRAAGRLSAVAGVTAVAALVLPAPPAQSAGAVHVRCSVPDLVAAIDTANGSPGADTLRLARGCTYKLTVPDGANPANGLPAITSEIIIDGNGATIARARSAPAFRILLVDSTGSLTLDKITIKGGRAIDCPGAPAPPFPPGIVCGGGINNQGILAVKHSRVIDNVASSTVYAEGGGIDTDGDTATVYDTEVSGNTAEYTGTDPSEAAAGGIANDGPLTVDKSRVHHNTVRVTAGTDSIASGAGITSFVRAEISRSSISHNHTSAPGGTVRGALTNSTSLPDTMTVNETVIRANVSSAPEGTVLGGGVGNGGVLSMTHSRVIDNYAISRKGVARGGGISLGAVAQLTLDSTYVLGNTASAPEGGTALGGGVINGLGGTVTADRSHLRENTTRASGGGTALGGGLFNAVGSTTLTNGTVTGNRAGDGGGIYEESGTVTLNATHVKRNKPNNCAPQGSVPDCVD